MQTFKTTFIYLKSCLLASLMAVDQILHLVTWAVDGIANKLVIFRFNPKLQ